MSKISIGEVSSIIRGVSYKKEQAQKEADDKSLFLLRANNISNGAFNNEDCVYIPRELVSRDQYVCAGDIVITMSSGSKAHVGKVALAKKDMDCTYGAFCAKIVPTRIVPAYLFYILQSLGFRQYIEKQCKGTNINNIKQSYIYSYMIELPELEKQHRIVSRIEELFSQLDASVATMRKVKEQLGVYRQAVLKEAFSFDAEKQPIRNVSSIVTSGSRGWAQYYANDGARFIRITDLTRDRIILKNNDKQFVSLPDGVEGKRTRLQENDVLISITADLGSIALIPSNIGEAYINQHIAMVRFNNPVQGKFMAWYLKSDYGQKDLLKNKRGAGKLGLGLDDIRNTSVPIVDDIIARNVVGEIENRLSVCDGIEQTIDVVLRQAEAMRQSILKREFEDN